ncbi:MAG: GSCFA domain-containing protein, partial [Bacteroidota bacterium]
MFRTELSPKKHEHSLSHTTPVLTIGSCFSDQIGGYFEKNKFDVLSNPFGTVYNPISIFKLLRFAVAQSEPEEYSYIHDQGLHSNFEFHSKFSSSDKNLLQQNIKNSIDNTHNFLKRADFLILTLGTAFAYERVENEQIVANCHKVPAKQFKKILLTESQIIKAFYGVKEELNRFNENLQIILTVSPVRHVKDTLELNAVSKSILRMVCHRLCDQYDSVHYFPSYEIVLDDLRDYRFYQRDMIHPNEIAEEY